MSRHYTRPGRQRVDQVPSFYEQAAVLMECLGFGEGRPQERALPGSEKPISKAGSVPTSTNAGEGRPLFLAIGERHHVVRLAVSSLFPQVVVALK